MAGFLNHLLHVVVVYVLLWLAVLILLVTYTLGDTSVVIFIVANVMYVLNKRFKWSKRFKW